MGMAVMLRRPLIVSEPGFVPAKGRRGFARGLVVALPIALLLWALIVWQF